MLAASGLSQELSLCLKVILTGGLRHVPAAQSWPEVEVLQVSGVSCSSVLASMRRLWQSSASPSFSLFTLYGGVVPGFLQADEEPLVILGLSYGCFAPSL